MGPIDATINGFMNPFTFKGRATRSEFWWFNLVYYGAMIAASIWMMMPFLDLMAQVESNAASGRTAPLSEAEFMVQMGGFNSTMWVVSLAFIWPMFSQIAVTVRRLHDTGRSGWWWWIAIVPFVGFIILMILMVIPSDTGRNDYGPPMGDGSAKARAAKKAPTDAEPARKRIPKGLPGEPYNPVNELTTAEELRALRASRMAN